LEEAECFGWGEGEPEAGGIVVEVARLGLRTTQRIHQYKRGTYDVSGRAHELGFPDCKLTRPLAFAHHSLRPPSTLSASKTIETGSVFTKQHKPVMLES
jgi:hypothetical protein